MMGSLEELWGRGLESEKVFRYFEEIAAIPHGSGHTGQISRYLVDFAAKHGLTCHRDGADNVVMAAEATPGYEDAPTVILQGHMDMVCEKETGCGIDFEKDGLRLSVDGDFLKAEGTTLGGDDGIAVCYALAILDSPEIAHPRLEAVFTADEEVGMLGAMQLDTALLKGRRLLNIDSDVEGHFLTSCAGGMTAEARIPVSYVDGSGIPAELAVTGLTGGHSGSEIDKERANANILMGRLLKCLSGRMELGIAGLFGGRKDNAIPRECRAKLLIPEGKEEEFLSCAAELRATLRKEYAVPDPELDVVATLWPSGWEDGTAGEAVPAPEGEAAALGVPDGRGEAAALGVPDGRGAAAAPPDARALRDFPVLSAESAGKVIFYLRSVPDGIQHRCMRMPELAETSLNLGILSLGTECLSAASSVRSSVSSRKEELGERLACLAEFLGGSVTVTGDYPAWEYREESKVRDTISEVYRELFGGEPVFEAIHAGLECGIFSGKMEGLDCVSFGPDNFDIHTPKERLSISSVERVWRLLVEFLRRCRE